MKIPVGRAGTWVTIALVASATLVSVCVVPRLVQAAEGQIIVLREVPRRVAYRPGTPAPPFAVKTTPPIDVTPVNRIGRSITVGIPEGELVSDLEAASITAKAPAGFLIVGGNVGLRGETSRAAQRRSNNLDGSNAAMGPLQRLGPSLSSQFRSVGRTIVNATSGLGTAIGSAAARQ